MALMYKKGTAPNPGNCAVNGMYMVLMKGFEPPTYALRMRCSTS